MSISFRVALTIRLTQKHLQIKQNMHHLFWNLKKCPIAFINFLPTFTVTITSKIIKFCRQLSLFVSVYFYRYLRTYKIPLPVNTINFLFFNRYSWNSKIALPVGVILFLFNWATGKTKTPILLYTMQHPRYFLIFTINLNEFAIS